MPKEREDVEATLEQVTTPDISQQKKKWRAIDWIAGITLIVEALLSIIWAIMWACGCCFGHQLQVYLVLVLIILTAGYLALIFRPIFKKDDDSRWFHARILSSGIVGGSYAFLLPAVMGLEEGSINSGGAAALRQAILLATGGLIGLIALGETRRKNDNDREAAENLRIHQQDMLNQQKKQFRKQIKKQQQQFEANAFKERKAERRERYTKAIEQLGDEKAPVRMGGVYTLVGLVDEWLEEENLPEAERLKEGQVIINNLCAYIRSPFTLASYYDELSKDSPISDGVYKDNQQEFYTDKAEIKAEADVRLGIIQEIHDRLQGSEENTPGTWSDFEYNFSRSTFFYPVDLTNSYYAKPINFSGSTYKGGAYFSRSTYKSGANFSGSTYEGGANFRGSTYKGKANFSNSAYEKNVIFSTSYSSPSIYEGEADFSGSTYEKGVIFSTSYFNPSIYEGEANFSGSTYTGNADFSGSTYEKRVIFSTSYFSPSIYEGEANFSGSIYKGEAYFTNSIYKGGADFSRSTYQGRADFTDSTYENETDFSGSIFYQETYFGENGYSNSSSCFTNHAPQFYDKKKRKNTLFGSHNNDFTVDIDKGYPIDLDSKGIPLNCKFLTSEQKEYLEGKLQEIEKINNKLREVKDPKEKAELLKKLQALNNELHQWRWEATTVKVEGTVLGKDDN